MATTKIWSVKNKLYHVINYIINPEKTSKEMYLKLHNIKEYKNMSHKTDEKLFVTALNCSQENAYLEMQQTKKRFRKEDGILGFHSFQSFAKGEVTPELAHKIGVLLAEEMWGDRFEVIVSTHINTNCIHNHFCINSVSFLDGKKYYDNHETYSILRETSDRLCEEFNLSVLKNEKCKGSNLNYNNFYKGYAQKSNYYIATKKVLDFAIEQANSYDEFIRLLNQMNYEVMLRAGKLSVRSNLYKKNIRIERAFGEEYEINRIKERILETKATKIPFPEYQFISKKKCKYKSKNNNYKNKKKVKGFRALYLYYCYLLKIYPNPRQKYSKKLIEDIKKMRSLSEQARFLAKTGIQTSSQLENYKSTYVLKRNELKSRRENLWRKYHKTNDYDEKQEIYFEIQNLTAEIKEQTKKIKMLDEIEKRSKVIKENIEELNEQDSNGKEKEKNGNIRRRG